MPDPLDYQQLIQDSLRGVVRRALEIVAEQGLPDNHHFYIGFLTQAPGTVMPEHLRQRYPEQMTVVLQHQFWDLRVRAKDFSVKLSFAGVQQEITVPFSAITSFSDPPFGVQFATPEPAEEEKKSGPRRTRPAKLQPAPEPEPPPARAASEPTSAKVVSLDEFRKK